MANGGGGQRSSTTTHLGQGGIKMGAVDGGDDEVRVRSQPHFIG
jgi:hypothetical protein